MRILATGATGYIGKALATALLARGHEVLGLVRAGSESRLPIGVTPVHGDLLEPAWGLGNATLPPCDVLVHLAASTKLSARPGATVVATNLRAIRELPLAMQRTEARRLIHFSTAFVAGDARGHLSERAPGDHRGRNPYERSKTAAERWLLQHAHESLDIVRPGIVFSTTDVDGSPVAALGDAVARVRRDTVTIPGDPRLRPGFVALGDVVEATIAILEKTSPRRAAFWNLVASDAPALADIAAALNRRLNGPQVRLSPAADSPLFATWAGYLTTHRTWDTWRGESRCSSGFTTINADAVAEQIARRVHGSVAPREAAA